MQNKVVSREAALAARQALLVEEKAHTRERARLAEARRGLPWTLVDEDYRFLSENEEQSLAQLFGETSQLIVYHLMFGEGWDQPCVGCAQWADAFSGTSHHFVKADARLVAVSQGSVDAIATIQRDRQWQFPWVSSKGGTFSRDFYAAALDPQESKQQFGAEQVEFDRGENHGVSVFYRNADQQIFHTYSVYNRGIEPMNGSFGYFDLLPKGRPW